MYLFDILMRMIIIKQFYMRRAQLTVTGFQIQDESDLEGRVPGSNKQLLDDEVHKVLGEDLESPPPPYSPTEYGLTLTGENWVMMC